MLSRHSTLAGGVLGLLLATAPVRAAQAQSFGDAMAYSALTLTPTAGLPTAPYLGRDALSRGAFVVRYGHLDANVSNIALGWNLPVNGAQFGITGGTTMCAGCDDRYMLGADLLIPLSSADLKAGLRPAIGASKTTGGGDAFLYSAALSMPIAWTPFSTGVQFAPFVEPGVGFGGISGTGIKESGTRFMTSGGLVVSHGNAPVSVVLSAQRVFIANGETLYGLGVTFGRSR